ncbi:HPr family phosphocarrier protein [Ferrimonas lipolytica]|uniref:HPr family phosphocarrier protein n=1 Tax=Ferrimonas lipolytica TaxID=2724191 RepID=A0A6H1UI52_9GAMM|nr:HPr family phosphocarrier protein [Ferrimonas lipolytica]QIZ77896.1 HPr family phosphocarrier protein [Ferrimonas lipolytica]
MSIEQRVCRQVVVINRLGLHARAATRLTQLATTFDAQIELQLEQQQANANSILGILMLQGCQGKEITVCSYGPDALAALDAICELFASRFDEDE